MEIEANILRSQDDLFEDAVCGLVPPRQLGLPLTVRREVAGHEADGCVVDLQRQAYSALVLESGHIQVLAGRLLVDGRQRGGDVPRLQFAHLNIQEQGDVPVVAQSGSVGSNGVVIHRELGGTTLTVIMNEDGPCSDDELCFEEQ